MNTHSTQSDLKSSARKKLVLKDIKRGLLEDEDLKFMQKGSKLQKIKSRLWMKHRRVKLLEDGLTVWCESKARKKSGKTTFSVMEIQAVREGHQSEVMQRHGRQFPETQCFTIVFLSGRSNLDLVANSPEERGRWVRGLHKLMDRAASMSQREKLHQYPSFSCYNTTSHWPTVDTVPGFTST